MISIWRISEDDDDDGDGIPDQDEDLDFDGLINSGILRVLTVISSKKDLCTVILVAGNWYA